MKIMAIKGKTYQIIGDTIKKDNNKLGKRKKRIINQDILFLKMVEELFENSRKRIEVKPRMSGKQRRMNILSAAIRAGMIIYNPQAIVMVRV